MLHHAARTRSSVVREAMHIVSLGDTQPMDGCHAATARRGSQLLLLRFVLRVSIPKRCFFNLHD